MSEADLSKRRIRRNRRDEVLDAARRLLFENGYRATSMQQVAAEAGYSKRTVYLDYLNKDDLFTSVCAEGLELLLAKLREVPWQRTPLDDCIDRFLEVYIDFSHEHPGYFRMIFSEATPAIIANCSGQLRKRVAELERACLAVLVALVERAASEGAIRGIDPWEAAGIMVGSATGIILLSMGGSQTVFSKGTLDALVTRAVRTLWRGLRSLDAPDRPAGGREGRLVRRSQGAGSKRARAT
ncbi:MAG: TetR/AcrR family transcriptional regulator [bacterium]